MPIDLAQQKIDYGATHFEWDFPEFIQHERGLWWYVLAGLIVLGILVYSLFTANILFAVLTIMVVIIMLFVHQRQPRIMRIKVTDEGLVIENRLYPYSEIRSFWMVYEQPDVKNLYVEFRSMFIPRLSVPYGELDPNRLKAFLLQYIDEDDERTGEPVSETLGRWLRL